MILKQTPIRCSHYIMNGLCNTRSDWWVVWFWKELAWILYIWSTFYIQTFELSSLTSQNVKNYEGAYIVILKI